MIFCLLKIFSLLTYLSIHLFAAPHSFLILSSINNQDKIFVQIFRRGFTIPFRWKWVKTALILFKNVMIEDTVDINNIMLSRKGLLVWRGIFVDWNVDEVDCEGIERFLFNDWKEPDGRRGWGQEDQRTVEQKFGKLNNGGILRNFSIPPKLIGILPELFFDGIMVTLWTGFSKPKVYTLNMARDFL